MQAASLCFTAPLPLKSAKNLAPAHLPTTQRAIFRQTVAVATPSSDTSTVDYSSSTSVFPAEACETLGGDACAVEMFPEVKPVQAASGPKQPASEDIEREYLEYSEQKTVFPGEACDDLGGEFCEAEYQQGVYAEGQSK